MPPAVAELKLVLGSAGYPLGPSPSHLKHARGIAEHEVQANRSRRLFRWLLQIVIAYGVQLFPDRRVAGLR